MSRELLMVRASYSFKPDEEQLKKLNALKSSGVSEFSTQAEGCLDWHCSSFKAAIDDILDIGMEFTIEGRTGLVSVIDQNSIESFGPNNSAPEINHKCNVIVSGNSLIEFTEVMAATNFCTDELQRHLNSGWRILAICVQPDQRRPDYILGKK